MTAEQLAAKYYRDSAHAYEVRKLSLMLFDEVHKNLKEISSKYRKILENAALLHDIGYNIDSEKHNKHAYKMICEKGIDGYEDEELEIIALTARYHRGAIPKKSKHKEFKALSKKGKKAVKRLAAILRIADGLDRAHMNLINSLKSEYDEENNIFYILLKSNIPERNPDITYAVRKKDLFEKAFKVQVVYISLKDNVPLYIKHL